jgi:hypothetical protein
MQKNIAKELLLEFLAFLEDKIKNDELLAEEYESIAKTIEENIPLYGTADDLANFYGKTKDAVWGIIKRNVVEKPRRNIVLHSFRAFSRKVPSSWRKKY